MPVRPDLVENIDKVAKEENGDGRRWHLGASVVAKECHRQAWYSWRWFTLSNPSGRMCRLWKRGHAEEPTAVAYLQSIGFTLTQTVADSEQQKIQNGYLGHYGGSGDGEVHASPIIGLEGNGLFECKTHGDYSFKQLIKANSVRRAKPDHWRQMQQYMHAFGFGWALYYAVNKNDDTVYIEIVEYDPTAGQRMVELVQNLIDAPCPPDRPHWASPTHFKCKSFCDHYTICMHRGKPAKSCRTCVNVKPVAGGEWYCDRFRREIPRDFTHKGCDDWETFK